MSPSPQPFRAPLSTRLLAPLLSRLPPRARRPVAVATYALGALLLLMALAWAGMPWLLRWQIESRGTEKLGRAVTVRQVEFAPWALRTTLHGLAVAKAQGQGAQLQVERIAFRTALSSLWNGAPVIDSLTIEAPKVALAHRGGGRYDVDDILQRLAEPDDPQRPPARFALRNFRLSGGELDFDDRGKPHQLRELVLDLPEISRLPRDRDELVAPHLAFVLDGSRFDSRAQGTPFAELRQGEVALRFQGLDLAPYLDYLPADAPLRLSAGVLDADLKIQVARPAAPAPTVLEVSGALTAHRLALAVPVPGGGQADFTAERLELGIGHLRPLAREAAIDRVELAAPRLDVRRGGAAPVARVTDASASAAAQKPGTAPGPAPAPAWKVALGKVTVRDGRLAWNDGTVAPPAALGLQGLSVDAGPAAWPLAGGVPFELRGELTGPAVARPAAPARVSTGARAGNRRGQGAAAPAALPAPAVAHGATTTLAIHGQAGLQDGKATVALAGLPLAWAAPYIQGMLRPALEGVLGTEATVAWSPAGINADAKTVQLDRVALRQGGAMLIGARQLLLAGVQVDTARHAARVQRLALADPAGTIARDAQGRWMYEEWMASAPAAPASTASAAPAGRAGPAAAPAWQVALGTVEAQGGAFAFRDASRRRPVAVDVSALQLTLADFAWPPAPPSAKGKPASLDLALQVAAGQATPGSLRYKGGVALAPPGLQGQVNARRLPLGAFEPYFGDALNVLVSRADVSFDGKVAAAMPPAGLQLQVDGDASVEDGRIDSATPETPAASPAASVPPATAGAAAASPARGVLTAGARRASSLLSWKTMGLRGVAVSLVPGQPLRGSVGETTLGDFFARIAIDETGRINLRDLVKQAPGEANPLPATLAGPVPPLVAAAVPAGGTAVASGEGMEMPSTPTRAPSAPAAAVAPLAAPAVVDPQAPALRFGPTRIVNGRVEFADRFIKPNYTASLSELNGSLGGFASVTGNATEVQMAALELKGKAEGTASLEISGRLNPLAKPLALDITGKVRDLDLPALSPYAVKYAGHGIERGKLSMDVVYQVQPSGQLTARNSLVLHQLTFGEQVAGAPASLPVKLAVALLADRNGVIDLDLPISGSLNDPQFSLGPVIGKAILNLLAKAITAPFSLLANAFGGSGAAAEAGAVDFAPGTALLSPAAREQLDKVAQVLKDKPALQVTVAGTASLAAEQDGYRKQRLLQLTRFEKRRKLLAAPQGADAEVTDITVSPQEYPELLRQVYARTDMPKPRNFVGLAKDLPLEEMEKLMMAQIDVDAATMQALAVQRGGAVRDYLAAQGVPAGRLYLGVPRQVEDPGGWTPRAELKLAAR